MKRRTESLFPFLYLNKEQRRYELSDPLLSIVPELNKLYIRSVGHRFYDIINKEFTYDVWRDYQTKVYFINPCKMSRSFRAKIGICKKVSFLPELVLADKLF